jgi:hypothetical protein
LEITQPHDDSTNTHQVGALVGSAEVAGWSLHMDEATLGNGSRRIVRFGSLAKFVMPVRGIGYGGIRHVVAFRHLVGSGGNQSFTTEDSEEQRKTLVL